MPTNITDGYVYMTNTFVRTEFLNLDWILSALFLFIVLVFISSKVKWWKILALPVTALLYAGGLEPHYLQIIISVILFVIELLTTEQLSKIVRVWNRERTPEEKSAIRALHRELSRRQRYEVGKISTRSIAERLEIARKKPRRLLPRKAKHTQTAKQAQLWKRRYDRWMRKEDEE